MDLKFSEMSVDTSLAQEYLKENEDLLELYNDYDGTTSKFHPYYYDGKAFIKNGSVRPYEQSHQDTLLNMASSLKQNATLIAQLEYHFRNIPIEVTNAQLNLLIQCITCYGQFGVRFHCSIRFKPKDSLLMFGRYIYRVCHKQTLCCYSKTTAAICHLLVTLFHNAGARDVVLQFETPETEDVIKYFTFITFEIKGLNSGTVAVVSEDADVDSAVDKLISVSEQAPWRLRRILVQESVYQQFKDALSWKCNAKKSHNKPSTSGVLCSETLTYNDRTFQIDPVELTEENPTVVTVEAYRTTKEMISLVQQDRTRYLSLWTNGIAGINEVTHNVQAPVVWVNNVADFRGPAQVLKAVLFEYCFVYVNLNEYQLCGKLATLHKLSQSWLKLNVESRRDILCGVLDKYVLLNPANVIYTEIKQSLLTCTLESFVDVGKDYVCIGMSQPGIMAYKEETIFTVECFKSILRGNALLVVSEEANGSSDYTLLEQAGVPVFYVGDTTIPDTTSPEYYRVALWKSGLDPLTRVVWTNSGTIFAN